MSSPFTGLRIFANDKGTAILAESAGNPLRFPPVITGGTMTLAAGNVSIWPGTTTQVFAINNSYPGPTVQVERGGTLTVKFINQLTEPSTIHWHGLVVPELMDGHPKDAVQPGASYTYSFPFSSGPGRISTIHTPTCVRLLRCTKDLQALLSSLTHLKQR